MPPRAFREAPAPRPGLRHDQITFVLQGAHGGLDYAGSTAPVWPRPHLHAAKLSSGQDSAKLALATGVPVLLLVERAGTTA